MICPQLRIANSRGVPGMAGALVQDAAGTVFLLSNHHVVFGGGAGVGEVVWAVPSDSELDRQGAHPLGRTRRGMIGRVTYAGETYFVDCAIVELHSENLLPTWSAIWHCQQLADGHGCC